MKVTVRKAPLPPGETEPPVVVELWMTPEEAKSHAHRSPELEDAIEDALVEHLRTRYRVHRRVNTGRHPS